MIYSQILRLFPIAQRHLRHPSVARDIPLFIYRSNHPARCQAYEKRSAHLQDRINRRSHRQRGAHETILDMDDPDPGSDQRHLDTGGAARLRPRRGYPGAHNDVCAARSGRSVNPCNRIFRERRYLPTPAGGVSSLALTSLTVVPKKKWRTDVNVGIVLVVQIGQLPLQSGQLERCLLPPGLQGLLVSPYLALVRLPLVAHFSEFLLNSL